VKGKEFPRVNYLFPSPTQFLYPSLYILSPQVDFTNILLKAFKHADPGNAKKTDSLTVFFVLLEFAWVKAAQ